MPRPKKQADLDTFAGRFGARLRELREKKNWTVDQFRMRLESEGLTVSNSIIYNWEGGHRTPNLDVLPMLAAVYGLTPRTVLPAE